ncbi:ATP-dependent DNA helicase [Trichonephila clavipes]|nr:ATP-dependent DNA helicase [Trichonephila clavipes]
MPKLNTQRGKEFREGEKKKKNWHRPVEKESKKQKNSANSSSTTTKSRSEYVREYRARKETSQNTILMQSLITNNGNDIETLLMTAQINTDFVNHPVPSAAEHSTSLVRVETDSCESIINSILPYKDYDSHKNAHKDFQKRFVDNPFDHGCSICDEYEILAHLPTLDLVSERLILPRIPFLQIRRLRREHCQFGILGQIINVPVSINTMVDRLPRNVDDDCCVNVHIKRRKIHRTSYLMGLVTKRTIKAWLQYLVATPLYRMYDVTIDDSFFNFNQSASQVSQEEISKNITIEKSLTAQQQTLAI